MHVGAGRCPELDLYLSLGAAQVLLVEPDPDLCAPLAERIAALDRPGTVELVAAALTDLAYEPTAWLHRWSRTALNGLRPPLETALETARGHNGDRIVKRDSVEVPRLEIAPLLARFAPGLATAGVANLLVLQAGGDELRLLVALDLADRLSKFDSILVKTAVAPRFDGGTFRDELLPFLRGSGYAVEDRAGPGDGGAWLLAAHRTGAVTIDLPMRRRAESLQIALAQTRHRAMLCARAAHPGPGSGPKSAG